MNTHLGIANVRELVMKVVAETPVTDIHTHLFPPVMGNLMLSGVDDMLVYHYLTAETFRYSDISYDVFWSLRKPEQAEHVWKTLFQDRTPLSEACRGIVTTLNLLGLDARSSDLELLRRWFAERKPSDYVDQCMQIAKVDTICMTNSPFDSEERAAWDGFSGDRRFMAALRIDPLLTDIENALKMLSEWGYRAAPDAGDTTFSEVRRFLGDWVGRIDARYVMASLPPDFQYPGTSLQSRIIEHAVLPACRELGKPLALMLGVRRSVNPALGLAGDGVGRSDLGPLSALCSSNSDVRFLVTVLSRECQQELCVLSRKFRNLHPFGCWWFMNVPSLVEEVTRMRVEMLGTSFTAQHSDARVLDQLLYKWQHSRTVIGRVIANKYEELEQAGWNATDEEIRRDVGDLFGDSFRRFLA